MTLLKSLNVRAVLAYLERRAAGGQVEALSALAAGLQDGDKLEVRRALHTELTTFPAAERNRKS